MIWAECDQPIDGPTDTVTFGRGARDKKNDDAITKYSLLHRLLRLSHLPRPSLPRLSYVNYSTSLSLSLRTTFFMSAWIEIHRRRHRSYFPVFSILAFGVVILAINHESSRLPTTPLPCFVNDTMKKRVSKKECLP